MSQGHNRHYSYSPTQRRIEIVSITVVFSMLAYFLVRGISVAAHGGTLGLVVLLVAAFVGFVGADLASGIVHWAGDTLGDASVPILGKALIQPFREHHIHPKDLARHDFIETNGSNCLVVTVPLGLGVAFLPGVIGWQFAVCSFLCSLSLFTVATNQFHKWAHTDNPPWWVRALQKSGLILSPEHHDVHHTMPHHQHYCITVGWLNPLLNKLGFFRGLEAIVGRFAPSLLHIEERLAFEREQARTRAQ